MLKGADLIRAKLADGRTLADGEVRDLLADYDALVARTTWRPIESAPRNGASILLADYDDDMVVGYWHRGEWIFCLADSRLDDGLFPDASHWMPLPEPPR